MAKEDYTQMSKITLVEFLNTLGVAASDLVLSKPREDGRCYFMLAGSSQPVALKGELDKTKHPGDIQVLRSKYDVNGPHMKAIDSTIEAAKAMYEANPSEANQKLLDDARQHRVNACNKVFYTITRSKFDPYCEACDDGTTLANLL